MSVLGRETARHYRQIEAITAGFEKDLAVVLTRAQASLFAKLRDRLILDESGIVKRTASNAKVLQKIVVMFLNAMTEQGYARLVQGFVGEFDGQLKIFDEILQSISRSFKVRAEFTKKDLDFFGGLKVQIGTVLEDVVELVGMKARFQALFSIGGVSFSNLTVALAEKLGTTVGEARSLAATSISTFYRTVASQGYQKIEDEGVPVLYTYHGPPSSDVLTRPFCKKLMVAAEKGKTWSREEIETMDNGQLPNTFETGGGYNCRHQWLIALDETKNVDAEVRR
jgi:hypothetical protein